MRNTDVAIVGGGLAGSTTAAMLGRAGIPAVLIDSHENYPPDFRVEKVSGNVQLERFLKTGIADAILRSATHDGENWICRFGWLLDKSPSYQYGMMYDQLVNTIRAQIQQPAEFVCAKVTGISTSAHRQTLTLSNGERISARLVVLAIGLNVGLRRNLGIDRVITSACHSVSIGFDIAPIGRPAFEFPALIYHSERASDRVAYLTLFPIGTRMRANFFIYRDFSDPWLRQMRRKPVEALNAALPKLRTIIGNFDVIGDVVIRPTDLYVSTGYRQPGIVIIGDAFATTCPATGTGTDKVFNDVVRLCDVYIPAWLNTGGMGAEKIVSFYDDLEKLQCDAWSSEKAFSFRAVSVDTGIYWSAQRWARVVYWLGKGTLRKARRKFKMDTDRQNLGVGVSLEPEHGEATRPIGRFVGEVGRKD